MAGVSVRGHGTVVGGRGTSHEREEIMAFFDDYPAFCGTGRTAAIPRRLNLRHRAIIEANQDILARARVLDLASHDGRWSFAALEAGATQRSGVEGSPRPVVPPIRTFS